MLQFKRTHTHTDTHTHTHTHTRISSLQINDILTASELHSTSSSSDLQIVL